ncbi:lanthionine synthetase LanC family protein [Kitasatospora sp. NPDC096204]|uniref:lanthionine synthetase LanC family protein n=1 Tax=Kitasatospora sp. NPDC096204 TaxID=3364094 RepID=UPI00381BFA40
MSAHKTHRTGTARPAAHQERPSGAERTARTARAVAHQVGERLRDPQHVAETAGRAFATAPADLLLPGWQPASALLGHAGIALLHVVRARHEPDWSSVAHAHLAAAVRSAPAAGPAGAGDLILPALLHARLTGGYAKLLARSTELATAHTAALVAALDARLTEQGPGLSYLDYDTVAGLAGRGRALLAAAGSGDERVTAVLSDLLRLLVRLTRPTRVRGREVPGWWCAPERYVVDRDRLAYPSGDFNLGAAHGICGPLSLLALAHRAGVVVPGGPEAIRSVTDWLLARELTDAAGAYWPARIPYEEETGQAVGTGAATPRAGWCYGASGIAWSLHLAGHALADPAVGARARDAMRAAVARPLPSTMADDTGLCHGRAGVLHTAVRMAAATGDPVLWAAADRAAAELAAAFDESAPFGYRQYVPTGTGPRYLDSPALIDGATGAALALAGYADAQADPGGADGPDWDAALLLT